MNASLDKYSIYFRVAAASAVVAAIVGTLLPNSGIFQRIVAPFVVTLLCTICYIFVYYLLRFFRYLPHIIFLIYSRIFFFAGLASPIMFPFAFYVTLKDDPDIFSKSPEVFFLICQIPLGLFTAAAAHKVIYREANAA